MVINVFKVSLEGYVTPEETLISTTASFIQPKDDQSKLFLYKMLKKMENRVKHVKVFLKENIPERYHWKNNIRIPEIVLLGKLYISLTHSRHFILADSGWTVWERRIWEKVLFLI